MGWIWLLLAGAMEMAWSYGMKQSAGLTRFWPVTGAVAAMAASVGFFALATRSIPLGTAYAAWAGLGVVGTTALGMVAFGEPAGAFRIACLGAILAGIAGLKLG